MFLFIGACGGGSVEGTDSSVLPPPVSTPPVPPSGPAPSPPADPAPAPEPPAVDPPLDNPAPATQSAFACGSGGASLTANEQHESYVLFESGAVRPLAISPSGNRLLFTNTPSNCLESYRLTEEGLEFESSIMVGLEPVAVAFNGEDEAWVINQLSDSISIVALGERPRVLQTLLVGDEPRDIVFAGENSNRAFVSASYRGQNHPRFEADDLLEPGLGRADVWVFDAQAPGTGLNGDPTTIVNLFADSPRALAVSSDGRSVYAAAFTSGNQTTVLSADVVTNAKPVPNVNHGGVPAPATGLIVRKEDNAWLDETGTDWSASVRLDLSDQDLFVIDAVSSPPRLLRSYSGLGSTLFNMAVNPDNEMVYLSNLEALNDVRFEGPGEGSTTVRGHIAENRISALNVADPSAEALATHLNEHVDFSLPEGSVYSLGIVDRSLSQPTAMVVSPDGETLYVAAFGSGKVAAIPTDELDRGTYVADSSRHLNIPGGGPLGLVLTPAGDRAIVYGRFAHELSLWDTRTGALLQQLPLFTPEPAEIVSGRRFLYDARESSANGTSACSSCHIFADMDQLAWDLGNPDGDLQRNPNSYVRRSPITTLEFHPMKGPMTTQTLRGISDSGPQHWRGDRTGQNRTVVNGELESLEAAAFKEFNPAFVGLVGRASPLGSSAMQAFTDFAMALTPPPNPIRQLDNSLTAAQARGRDIYFDVDDITGIGSCNHCHTLDPLEKQFGTSGLMTFEGQGIAENFKIPHFRNAYAKVGMFGTSGRLNQAGFAGDQIKGFGYLHDGSIASLLDFFASPTFVFPEPRAANVADVVRFVMAADSNMAPVVGQQITLQASTTAAALDRLSLLEGRSRVLTPRAECDLIVRGWFGDFRFSALYEGAGGYLDTEGRRLSSNYVREQAQVAGNSATFTCVPPNNGARLALN
ncbi:MAG: hypothetical protein AAF098_06500 [Pseudomonadota bacterium]